MIDIVKKRKYRYITIQNERYSETLRNIIKEWSSLSKWNKKGNRWEIKLTFDTAFSIYFIAGKADMEITDKAMKAIRDKIHYFQKGYQIKESEVNGLTNIDSELHRKTHDKMTHLQKVGASYMAYMERCFNCDEMGSGKTLQTLAAIEENSEDAFPALILCPNAGMFHWRKEIKRFFPNRSSIGLSKGYHGEDYIIANHYMVVNQKRFLKDLKPKTIVVDESTDIKNNKRKSTQAIKAIRHSAKYRYCLSGTVIENSISEIMSQFEFLDRLDDLGGYMAFQNRYVGDDYTAQNLNHLQKRLSKTCLIRRSVFDIHTDLKIPESNYEYVGVNNPETYNLSLLDPNEYRYKQRLEHRNQQSLFSREEIQKPKDVPIPLEIINAAMQGASIEKVDDVHRYIRNRLKSGEIQKAVIFSSFIQSQDEYIRRFREEFETAFITHNVNDMHRVNAETRFNNDPNVRVIVCSTNIASRVLNLSSATHLFHADLLLKPTTHRQAERRPVRPGQTNRLKVTYFVAKGTIEEDIKDLIEDKQDLLDSVFGEGAMRNYVQRNVIDILTHQNKAYAKMLEEHDKRQSDSG